MVTRKTLLSHNVVVPCAFPPVLERNMVARQELLKDDLANTAYDIRLQLPVRSFEDRQGLSPCKCLAKDSTV